MMIYKSATATTAAAVLSMTAGAAVADVTPAQVWDEWTANMTDFGLEVSAQEAQSGGNLTLTDIVMTYDAPEGSGDTEVSFPELTLSDNGDGTVSVSVPDTLPISIATEAPEQVSFDLVYTTSDLDMVVSGEPSEMTFTYSAATFGVKLADLVSEGKPVELGKANVEMQDVEGSTVTRAGDLRQSEQNFTSGPVSYAFDVADPENPANRATISGHIDTLDMTGTAALPTDMNMTDMAAALDAGFAVDGTYTFGPSASAFEFIDDGKTTTGTSSSASSELSVTMDDGHLKYGAATQDLAMDVTVPDLPFPVAMNMKEVEFGLDMPIAKAEEAQDFGLTFVLGDLTVSDQIWALFDPEGKLPRDPATLAIELEGKARVMVDVMDPAQIASIEEDDREPAALEALTVKRLLLRAVGAELTGEGDLTFDNDDKETYPGMPAPVGEISLSLSGANSLLDTLVEMGLVPEGQLMGVRMMMGVIAKPGEGEDVLVSDIEFTEDGHVLANGQRLK